MDKSREQKMTGGKGKRFGTEADPYLPEGGRHELAVCTTCKAIYRNKSWFYDEELYRENFQKETTHRVTCPGCQKVQDHYYEGVLTLEGKFLAQHHDDIMALLHRQAEQVARKNPLERVIQIVPEGDDRLIVETTTDRLAQRLGKAVYRAYKGNLDFRWSHMNKFVRVYWSR